jgi:hypothetical protein
MENFVEILLSGRKRLDFLRRFLPYDARPAGPRHAQ